MDKQPIWVKKWLRFGDHHNLMLEFDKVPDPRATNLSRVVVRWGDEDQTVTVAQLDMYLNDQTHCEWKPHLTPEKDMVIGDLFYYSPAAIFRCGQSMFSLVPDIDWLDAHRVNPQYFDFVQEHNHLFIGVGSYKKVHHVYHQLTKLPIRVHKGEELFAFYLSEWEDAPVVRDFSPVENLIWRLFASPRMKQQTINQTNQLPSLEIYAKHTYKWALKDWRQIDWQQFELDGKQVGGWVFLARAAQKPGLGKEDIWREKKSIWNQAWFSSLRSAFGCALWGKRWNDAEMVTDANLAKELALSSPQQNGLFPSVFEAGNDGDWASGHWTNSDRRPPMHEKYGHILDMSWTSHWMLRWYQTIDQDSRLYDYVKRFADRLLDLQEDDGSFPAWIRLDTGEKSKYLSDGPETSMQAWFLAEMYEVSHDDKYLRSSERAMKFVEKEIIPTGRWEDFETYFSCSSLWAGKVYHEKESRSGLYSQCNFSIYWSAEAFKTLYAITREDQYLKLGEQLISELSLYQAAWSPKYMNVPTIGGFTVMNTDDEWDDARQSLFAETYYDYYELTHRPEYLQRSLSAMQASFYMMYCPENPQAKSLYEQTFPFFNEADYGFEMENAGHADNINKTGEFTGFDWGNGSACTSLIDLLVKSNQGKILGVSEIYPISINKQ